MNNREKRIIVALDFPSAGEALALAGQIDPDLCRVKVGKELFTRSGPDLIESLQNKHFEVFLDLKYHDIPNTVAAACRAAADLGVWMVNVHASGGRRMMEAAGEALAKATNRPLLIAVTLLTSLTEDEIREIGFSGSIREHVLSLARLTREAGLDGVVCSAREAAMLREQLGDTFCLVTPGIRPAGSAADDQRRIVTPADALGFGSDYLVIGRPVTAADDPQRALEKIQQEISAQPA